ncbi:alpha/beta hydrolase [Actinokineospora enzanensis]|uniref:alpha/beta hydrolase n=1 Tax=Actinokineospora enzanensis TaxID=155975 RepID=UPI000371FD08|nr:alpha/beta hydrolase [Actinokineospora enzanensis]
MVSFFRRFPLVIAGVAALALSACTSVVDGSPTSGVREQLGPQGPVPPGLERFYGQRIDWEDCAPYGDDEDTRLAYAVPRILCARMTVPLDYSKPDGRTITIAILRHKATGARVGALLVNPGGPGVSGMMTVSQLGAALPDNEMVQRFDLIGFDPRGVGASEPHIRCYDARQFDADRLAPPATTVEESEKRSQQYVAACIEHSGGVEALANVGSRDVARDMDVLRSALGAEKLNYLGYSYGTRLGTYYASMFPKNIRAMILDGALDPDEDPVDAGIAQAKGFDQALQKYVEWCAAQAKCGVKNQDQMAALLRPLKDAPLAVGDRKLSFSDASIGLTSALYSELSWTRLQRAMNELAKGDGATLLEMADLYLGRQGDGEYNHSTDARNAIRCVDDPRVTDRAVVADRARRIVEGTRGTFMADDVPVLPALDVCGLWPVPVTGGEVKIFGIPVVLVVSTTGDPATPYQAGVRLAQELGGRLITFNGTQHTAFLGGHSCVDDAGIRYLVYGTVPGVELVC